MNDRAVRVLLSALLMAGTLGGCAGVGLSGGGGRAAPVLASAPAPEPQAPLDPADERRMAKELVRDVDEFHRFLRDKNVEQASSFVDPERRKAFQDELWDFASRFKLEAADVASYQFLPGANGVTAKVKVLRTLFEKNSVVPKRVEVWMTWALRSGRWVLEPDPKK